MRLTLDWDSDELKDIHQPAVRNREPFTDSQTRIAQFADDDADAGGNKYEIWQSASHGYGDSNGYHYIEYNESGSLQRLRPLRTAYGDDKLRVSLDRLREEKGSPFNSVLYHVKGVRPGESKPYQTGKRASLQRREGFESIEAETDTDRDRQRTKTDGSINYAELAERLADHPDFGSRGALYEQVQGRDSVEVNYSQPRKRAYQVISGSRDPGRYEKMALRDYALARDIGHYGDSPDPAEVEEPPALRDRTHRTTIHEYFEMPDIDFNEYDFGEPDTDSDSEYFPVNIRTGRYRPDMDTDALDELTIKQVHGRISDEIADILSPGIETADGFQGVSVDRWREMISIEQDRPLDDDETARYRQIWHNNQPDMSRDRVMSLHQSAGIEDAFGPEIIHFEVIVYDGEDALQQDQDPDMWWLARGIIDGSDPDARRAPLRNSVLVADTRGFI